MATVGSFGIDLGLNTARFEEGLKRAGKQTRTFEQTVKSSFGIVASAGRIASAGLAVIAGGLTALTIRAFDAVGAQVDLAASLNVSTQKLAAFQVIAQASGVETEKLTSYLQRLTVSIGKAAEGSKAQAEAFAKLGLSARELSSLTTDEQLEAVAAALTGYGNATERATIAQAIFGKGAAALLPVLKDIAADSGEAERAALAMGFALSDIDAAVIDEAGDAMGRVQQAVQGAGNLIARELSPYITKASNDFVNMAIAAEGGRKQIAIFVESAGTGIAWVAQSVLALRVAFNLVTAAIGGLAAGLAEAASFFERRMGEMLRIIGRAAIWTDEVFGHMDDSARARAEALASWTSNLFGGLRDEIAKTAVANLAEMRELASGELPVEGFQRWMREAEMAADAAAANIARIQGAVAGGGSASGGSGGPDSATPRATQSGGNKMVATMSKFDAMRRESERNREEMLRVAEDSAAKVADAFDRILFAGFADGMKGIREAFKQTLVEMGLDLARSQLRDALTGLFGSILGGGKGGGFASLIGAIGGAKSGASGGLKEMASGGSFTVPGPSTGDRVIPIFRANGGETVTVTPKGQGGGGLTINQTINAPGATAGDQAALRQAAKAGAAEAVATIINMRSRGRL